MSGTMPHRPSSSAAPLDALLTVGRYDISPRIAAGGMASVHLGRSRGAAGFSRTVAIKRLHPQYQSDPEFVSMFLDEARIAARIRHPNVVPTLDVNQSADAYYMVMEYIEIGRASCRERVYVLV